MLKEQIISQANVDFINSRGGMLKVLASPKTLGTTKQIFGKGFLHSGEEIRAHSHSYGEEIIHIISGKGKVIIDGIEVFVYEGDTVLIKQNQKHILRNNSNEKLDFVFTSSPLAPSPEFGHKNV